MEKDRIVRFDPWLLGAIQKAMGKLPAIPGDLAKIKSLTFYDDKKFSGEPGQLFMGWMELTPGDYSAIGKMTNLHTLQFMEKSTLQIRDFGFLTQCRKLKKLDLSNTDFTDCTLLAELPNLQYAMLPDRRRLIHTEVLEEIKARTETRQERDERSRAESCIDLEARWRAENGITRPVPQMCAGPYTADPRLIRWISVSLGKVPENPGNLLKVRQLDSRKVNHALDTSADRLPSWLTEKEGDFSLLGKLPNLEALLLWGVTLEDFSFLAECKTLIYLNLWDTNFSDCGLLTKLEGLEIVCLPDKRQLEHLTALTARQEACRQEMQQNPTCRRKELVIWCETPCDLQTGFSGQTTRIVVSQGKDAYRNDEFDNLATVRGEDVVIAYEGGKKIRHVEANFYMDAAPPLWKVFVPLTEDEDNWAKLTRKEAGQMTEELTAAIARGDVATLYLSLEPWGEGHVFELDFAGGWVSICYMDDETPVYYNCYNSDYTDAAELSPVEVGEQTPVPKMLALEDLELAARIVRHILETGQLLPGTLWKTGTGGVRV